MQLGISNISWLSENIKKNTMTALDSGFNYIESAYIKVPMSKSVYAIQGVFYKSGIESFEDPKCEKYFRKVIDSCLKNNIKVITFGSPSMRVGNKEKMLNLLANIDTYIDKRDCIVCVEPNSKIYNGKYYYSLDEIVSDIHSFNNVKTMIDSGNLYLEGYDSITEYQKYKEFICHVHLSTSNLDPIRIYRPYIDLVSSIKELGYDGGITYEYLHSYNVEQEIKIFLEKMLPLFP